MHPRQPLPPSATSLIRLQAGVLTRAQAIGCGVAPNAVTRMARQWQTLSPGVFLATPAADGRLSWEVRAWAVLLHFGPQARLWLDDAGVVHGLVEVPAPVHPGRIDANPIRPHGLPVGRRQHRVIRTVGLTDVGYPEYQLIVEVDGRIGHEGEGGFRDKHRDNDHTIVGWTSLRFGWDDVSADPCAVAAYTAEMLIQRGWSGYPDRCPRCEHRPFR